MLTHDEAEVLLKRYGIHAPVTDQRFLEHADLERGTPVQITCLDSRGREEIVLTCQDFTASKPCPLTQEDAANMVNDLQQRHLIPDRGHERHTLEHLLLRCSELFAAEHLERLRLAPVYLRENDYRVAAAEFTHRGAVDAKPRLDPGAHDTGAVFAYRPTARGRSVPKPPHET